MKHRKQPATRPVRSTLLMSVMALVALAGLVAMLFSSEIHAQSPSPSDKATVKAAQDYHSASPAVSPEDRLTASDGNHTRMTEPITRPQAPCSSVQTMPCYSQSPCGLGPAAPCPIPAVDCSTCDTPCCRKRWSDARLIQWQQYAQGEYCGQARTEHVHEYRIRPEDELDFTYRLTREKSGTPYKLNVGDIVSVESFTDEEINRELLVQPDGTITLRLLGQVQAYGLTVPQLREKLDEAYKQYYKVPSITVTPIKVDTRLEDLRAAVNSQYSAQGGQNRTQRVTPSGQITLPMIGTVRVQGLTVPEIRVELNERYHQLIEGIEVMPSLVRRAPRYVFVLGEVANPGRFELTGPTTLTQSIAMAGSWRQGADLDQVIILRRGDDWRMMATRVDIKDILYGRRPCSRGEIWIADGDVIILRKNGLQLANDFIDMTFTRGLYGIVPIGVSMNFAKLSSL